ncbi:hypothetical protein PUMCH_004158 [Australozyma saopauloensis]|uniref:Mso1 N-terminal domain-containing protein n=1 Tax=Australozyma saopauloensis TaxID=291208 RepID=A0AAX4HEX6_9ASCO|nr:hypothetical protein PUMCH_004158 [[Candida] saopauloensis]
MSQYQPNAAPNRSFIEKINSKFSNLSVSGSLSSGTEHDGASEDQTLIHKAFVKFFDQNNEPYPEWLGVKHLQPHASRHRSEGYTQGRTYESRGSEYQSQYQPVRAAYNSPNLQQYNDMDGGDVSRSTSLPSSGSLGGYTRNSRLQEMYNKSRHLQADSSHGMVPNSALSGRNNSVSQMRRDRVLNGMSLTGESRSNWGR